MCLIGEMRETAIEMPTREVGPMTKDMKRLHNKKLDRYLDQKEAYDDNKKKLYMVIWDQCSKSMQNRIEAGAAYQEIKRNKDVLRLLLGIKGIMHSFNKKEFLATSLNSATINLYECKQGRTESCANYLARFRNRLEVLEYYGGSFGEHLSQVKKEMEMKGKKYKPDVHVPGNSRFDRCLKKAHNRCAAELFLRNVDSDRYRAVQLAVANDYIRHGTPYPADVDAVYSLIVSYKCPEGNKRKRTNDRQDDGKETDATKRYKSEITLANIKCFRCKKKGHKVANCPEAEDYIPDKNDKKPENDNPKERKEVDQKEKGVTITTIGTEYGSSDDDEDQDDTFGLNFNVNGVEHSKPSEAVMKNKDIIPKEWILLDNQSTVHIFKNRDLLENIYKVKDGHGVRCYCNGGVQDTIEKGTLPGFGKVWYNETSLANILSFALVSDKFRITVDTWEEQAFIVHIGTKKVKFVRHSMNLYYHDTRWGYMEMKEKAKERKEKKHDAVVMIATVEGNTQGFTPREIRGARAAQKLYDIVGRPSYKDFETMIRFSAIKNCPVQVQDVKNAWKIYGPSVERLRGRMVRQTPAAIVEDYDRIPIPTATTEALENLSMCGDIFFVDGVIFLMTITKKLGFTMIERLPNRKLKETILPSLRKMFRAYALRGATIRSLFTDVEFELLKQELIEEDKVQLNISSANEHVP